KTGRPHRARPPRPQNATRADAILQTGELLRGPRSAAASGSDGFDRQWLRFPAPRESTEGGDGCEAQTRQRRIDGRGSLPHGADTGKETRLPAGAENANPASEDRNQSD